MILITPLTRHRPADLRWSFMRASGPGGQNVNKVATAVELRFNINDAVLPDDMRLRLRTLAGRQLTQAGELVITAQEHRSQERNREDALHKLVTLLRKAAVRPRSVLQPGPQGVKTAPSRIEGAALGREEDTTRQTRTG